MFTNSCKPSLNIVLAIPNIVKHHFHVWPRPASGARHGEQQQLAGRGTCSFHQINGLKLEIISRIRLDVVLIKPFISPYFHLAPGTFLQNQLCGWKWNSLCRFHVVCFEPSKGVVLKQLLFPAKEQNKEEFTLQIYYHCCKSVRWIKLEASLGCCRTWSRQYCLVRPAAHSARWLDANG